MTRAALALALFLAAGPALAAGNAPGAMAALVPGEWQVSLVMGELPPCTVTGDCCGVHRPCGDWYQRPADPAPVPLPFSGALLALGLAGLMMWRR